MFHSSSWHPGFSLPRSNVYNDPPKNLKKKTLEKLHPGKFNMEHNNGGLEEYVPFQLGDF